ncbi:hypothetical protein [Xanthomonas axonopodis]|uniref:hypothetical protein n=1 Tax=Xanthomonas axonopodis TaxID=53413 RepID=UPI0020160414|nr:hypothetical protein [Xanthomonas axonopodis]
MGIADLKYGIARAEPLRRPAGEAPGDRQLARVQLGKHLMVTGLVQRHGGTTQLGDHMQAWAVVTAMAITRNGH